MNQLPNIITSVRLFAALAMLLQRNSPSAWSSFIGLFIAAGISDMLDGFIARRYNWCSAFGANLDSISDLTLYFAVFVTIATQRTDSILHNTGLACLGLSVQLFHLWLSARKFKTFPAYHSNFTRLCAYAIFFLVIAFWFSSNDWLLTASLALWTLCSCEGVLITIKLKYSRQNVASLWSINEKTLPSPSRDFETSRS